MLRNIKPNIYFQQSGAAVAKRSEITTWETAVVEAKGSVKVVDQEVIPAPVVIFKIKVNNTAKYNHGVFM